MQMTWQESFKSLLCFLFLNDVTHLLSWFFVSSKRDFNPPHILNFQETILPRLCNNFPHSKICFMWLICRNVCSAFKHLNLSETLRDLWNNLPNLICVKFADDLDYQTRCKCHIKVSNLCPALSFSKWHHVSMMQLSNWSSKSECQMTQKVVQ